MTTLEENLQHPTGDQEALIKVENVSKKFCRSLKKSLKYVILMIIKAVPDYYPINF